VQRAEDATFTSKIISRPEREFAAGSRQNLRVRPASSTSAANAALFHAQDGIKPEEFFSRIAYSGAHDATAAWVQAGS
jgi:phosphonate transport system substrate-binding protein